MQHIRHILAVGENRRTSRYYWNIAFFKYKVTEGYLLLLVRLVQYNTI